MSYNKYATEYAKERKLLLQQVRRMKKRGYIFNEEITPKKPKRITAASVRELKKRRANIYKKAELEDIETGVLKKVKSRKSGLKQEKLIRNEYERRRKYYEEEGYKSRPDLGGPDMRGPGLSYEEEEPNDTYNDFAAHVIDTFRFSYDHYNEKFVDYMNTWLDELIRRFGTEDVAEMLESAAADGNLTVPYQAAYVESIRNEYLGRLLDYLPDAGPMTKEDIFDAMAEMERFDVDESMSGAEVAAI